MIISTLYRCDNCGKKDNGTSDHLPEGWALQAHKGDLCPTCIRIAGKPINNVSMDKLARKIRAFPMDRLRSQRGEQ
jgi:DNA-directed RNA polymerase subunit RPC12/RpoP